MLQNIRKNIQGTMAKVIVALIVVPFALFGIESLIGGGGVQYAAEVNGEGISQSSLQQEMEQQKRRLLASMGDQIDPAMLDDQFLVGPSLEFMVQKTLLLQAAQRYGLAVSDQRLGAVVAEIPAFQTAGRFDPVLYRRVLGDQGYSPSMFKQRLRDDLMMTQLRAGLAASEFVTPAAVAQFALLSEQQRDLRYLVMPLDDFRSEVEVSEEELIAWYEANSNDFQSPETVSLQYIEVRRDNFREPVAEEAVRELYDLERDSMEQAEERAVSHILFEQRDGESDEALQERIESVRLKVEQGDQSFADLARENSDDIGSANFGGQLGYTSGETFPAEIEEVVATLAVNQLSSPTESDSGWHLLMVTEIREAQTVDFEAVSMELEQRLQDEQASVTLVKRVEELRDLVFNAEDLEGPAAAVGLEVQTSEAVERNASQGLFSNPQLQAAAFSAEVLEQGFNSEVIELGQDHYVVLRLAEHKLPELLPLDDVREQILTELKEQSARDAIVAKAEELLQALRGGASIEDLALNNEYQWQVELGARRDNSSVPPDLLGRAFELPEPGAEGIFEFVQNADGDIELFQLVRVLEADPETLAAARRDSIRQGLLSQVSQAVDTQYQEELRNRADVVTLL